jgi:hypothetical protein
MDDLFVESLEYKGYQIDVFVDDFPETPNDWDGPLLIYDHRDFNVGPKGFSVKAVAEYLKLASQYENVSFDLKDEFNRLDNIHDDRELTEEEEDRFEELDDLIGLREDYGQYTIFPVFAYIHSGVALSLSNSTYPFTDRFDTSCAGFILVEDHSDQTDTSAFQQAKSAISEWNIILRGEVYRYEIIDPDGEEIDSLWGLFGEDHLKEEYQSMIDLDISGKRKKHFDQLKKRIRNRVPLAYREELKV